MRHGNATREEAVTLFGEDFVVMAENEECEPTGRLQTDGDTDVEFACCRSAVVDGEERFLTVYYYQTDEVCSDEDLFGQADWDIHGYEID